MIFPEDLVLAKSAHVKRDDIRDLESIIRRGKSVLLILITFEPLTRDMIQEATSAKIC